MTTTEQERKTKAERIAEEFKDLPYFDPDFDFPPEQYQEMIDDHLRELEAEKNATILFDPTDRKNRSYADCKDRYDKDMADKMLLAKKENNGRLSKEDYAELMGFGRKHRSPEKIVRKKGNQTDADRKEKKTPKEKQKVVVRKREHQKGDEYFMKTDRGMVRNETYRELFKGPGVVYEWLWANIVREQWKDNDEYPIKKLYYDNGYLAYCTTYSQIGKACRMSKNTVHGYIEKFEANGIVQTESFTPEGKKQGQTVFILGTWEKRNGKMIETYFRDSVFIDSKAVKF